MRPLYVQALGVVGTGLSGWDQTSRVLLGTEAWRDNPPGKFTPGLLPANERRRATRAVRLAFRAAEEAIAATSMDPGQMATVFASSDADTHILNKICTALSEPARLVSPTDFHNSVHNAAAGYWHIAVGSRAASSSISAWDASFAAGYLEAAVQLTVEGGSCLLTAFDVEPPELLGSHRPMRGDNAVAMVLSASQREESLARLDLEVLPDGSESVMSIAGLEPLRRQCSALKALPVLELIARSQAGEVIVRGAGSQYLKFQVTPC